MVCRNDVWGAYTARESRQKGKSKSYTAPAGPKRGKVLLTPFMLKQHFAGKSEGHILGLHPCNERNECRWFVIDVDKHDGDDTADPQKNLAAALRLHDQLVSLGFDPLLTDSNGAGGYHALVILDTALPLAKVYDFAHGLVADHANLGLAGPPKSFQNNVRSPSASSGTGSGCRAGITLAITGRACGIRRNVGGWRVLRPFRRFLATGVLHPVSCPIRRPRP
jgi:hypothetical protein